MINQLRRILHRFVVDFEYGIILLGAAIVAVLSLLDVISDTKPLVASTLAILSVMAFAALRQAGRREADDAMLHKLESDIVDISVQLETFRQSVASERQIYEAPGGAARNAIFNEALTSPRFWHFRGGTGTFLRARTLKAVADSSRQRAGTKSTVTIQIIDPADELLCQRYADYRRRLASQPANLSARNVQLECLASIIAAAWYSQHEGLSLTVALSSRQSTLRFDVSDTAAIITNENKNYPALVVRPESRLYHAILNDVETSIDASRLLDLRRCPPLAQERSAITESQVRPFLTTIGADFDDLASSEIAQIVDLALDRKDDYA